MDASTNYLIRFAEASIKLFGQTGSFEIDIPDASADRVVAAYESLGCSVEKADSPWRWVVRAPVEDSNLAISGGR
jgi:hypothetical protein